MFSSYIRQLSPKKNSNKKSLRSTFEVQKRSTPNFCLHTYYSADQIIPYQFQFQLNLGTTRATKIDVFLKKVGRGGLISDPKNYIADFLVSKRYILVVNFGKKFQKGGEGGGHLQSKKFHCKFTQVSAYLRTFAKESAM